MTRSLMALCIARLVSMMYFNSKAICMPILTMPTTAANCHMKAVVVVYQSYGAYHWQKKVVKPGEVK